jgi:hypothetical protein
MSPIPPNETISILRGPASSEAKYPPMGTHYFFSWIMGGHFFSKRRNEHTTPNNTTHTTHNNSLHTHNNTYFKYPLHITHNILYFGYYSVGGDRLEKKKIMCAHGGSAAQEEEGAFINKITPVSGGDPTPLRLQKRTETDYAIDPPPHPPHL